MFPLFYTISKPFHSLRIHADTAMIEEALEAERHWICDASNSYSVLRTAHVSWCATVAARDAYVVVSAQPHLQTSVGELQYVTPPSQQEQ